MSTLHILASILTTWMQLSVNDRFVIVCRDATKPFIKALKSKHLIIYPPSTKVFEAYPHFSNHVFRGFAQIHEEVEAELYWYKTGVPWLIDHIPHLQQPTFYPSMLFSPNCLITILSCTDNTLFAIPQSQLNTEASIEKRFKSHAQELSPVFFKGVDVRHENGDIILSQTAHLDTKERNMRSAVGK